MDDVRVEAKGRPSNGDFQYLLGPLIWKWTSKGPYFLDLVILDKSESAKEFRIHSAELEGSEDRTLPIDFVVARPGLLGPGKMDEWNSFRPTVGSRHEFPYGLCLFRRITSKRVPDRSLIDLERYGERITLRVDLEISYKDDRQVRKTVEVKLAQKTKSAWNRPPSF